MKNTLGNGGKAFKMDMVNIIGCKIKFNIKYSKMYIKAIGVKARDKGLEFFFIRMDVNTKVISLKI